MNSRSVNRDEIPGKTLEARRTSHHVHLETDRGPGRGLLVNERGGAGPDRRGRPARPMPGVQASILPELARIDWIERSDVAALREGVIEKMELQIGMPVKKGGTIGILHREMAELTVRKNQAPGRQHRAHRESRGPEEVAASVVARNKRLNERKPGMVSAEDVAKAEGELKVADGPGPRSQGEPRNRQGRAGPGRYRPSRSTRSSPRSTGSSSSG